MAIEPVHSVHDAAVVDRIIVCSGGDADHLVADHAVAWIRKSLRSGARVGAVADAAFFLARAGLLDGHACTLHWTSQPAFEERFPEIDLRRDLYVIDRMRFTSAGGVAGLDMMLDIIATDFGAELAAGVAEWFVHSPLRSSVDRKMMPLRLRTGIQNELVLSAIAIMEEAVEERLRMADLAERLGVSRDKLERVFRSEAGVAPSAYYRRLAPAARRRPAGPFEPSGARRRACLRLRQHVELRPGLSRGSRPSAAGDASPLRRSRRREDRSCGTLLCGKPHNRRRNRVAWLGLSGRGQMGIVVFDPDHVEDVDFKDRMRHPAAADPAGGMWLSDTEPSYVDANALRHGRLNKLRAWMAEAGYGALVLFDPYNQRYATGSRNMFGYFLRNSTRYFFIPVEGPIVLFEYPQSYHVSMVLDTVDEARPSKLVWSSVSNRDDESAGAFADEIADLLKSHGGSMKIGLDRCNHLHALALEKRGCEVKDCQGEILGVRAVKTVEEVKCLQVSMAGG